ncbi:glycosyltransferase family 2 protein [uncultured Cellulomonas sp.]|uniref:glycosyltransferase family 2 protein n=1 Tax=uncultured Cellulomonas sp. TaxID=189682 RepID=UPI002606F269|nr:glycosyltransferase [uncultured Cellulomonas sp.]
MAPQDLRVTVAVLTYRRPADLAVALPMLVEQALAVGRLAQVLVVDNDPDAGARSFVEAHGGPVRYVHEPRPGIAAGRNRALDEAASSDVVVFVDDDERPCAGWLRLLLEQYVVDRPLAVVGPVVSTYDVPPDAWVAAGRFFDRRRLPTGTEVTLAATNNLLLDVELVRALELRFDERFGISGGSDSLFTRQAAARGGRMVWCDEALVTDVVPASRVTRRWVLRRAFRAGNTWSRTVVDVAPSAGARTRARARLAALGAVRTVGGAARYVLGVATRSLTHQARGARTAARGAGVLAGLTGAVYAEYRRDPRPRAG